MKWKNVDRAPRGFQLNLLIKINTKLGGTNHTLVPRAPARAGTAGVFQDPPNSLSWLFDKHCMLVGVDVSHAEPGSDRESLAAVVRLKWPYTYHIHIVVNTLLYDLHTRLHQWMDVQVST